MAQVSVNKGIDLVSFIGDCLDMVIEGKMVTPRYLADGTSLMGEFSI